MPLLGVAVAAAAAAGTVITAGACSVVVWHYRRQIKKLIEELMQWVNKKIKAFTKNVQDIFRSVIFVVRNVTYDVSEPMMIKWKELNLEERQMVIHSGRQVVIAAVNSSIAAATDSFAQIGDNNPKVKQVLEAMRSRLNRFESDCHQTMTRHLL